MIANPTMKQEAPFPTVLAELVEKLEYRPGWTFRLAHMDRGQDSIGLTLTITTQGYDSYNPGDGETYRVRHFMLVPPAAYNEQSWQRWLLDQCLLVERHECCEFFKINGKRPYAPHHGPGNDPYIIFERGTDEDARTMYTGEVRAKEPRKSKSDAEALAGEATAPGPGIKSYTADQLEVARRYGGVVSEDGKDSESDRLVPRGAPPRPQPSEATHYPPDRPASRALRASDDDGGDSGVQPSKPWPRSNDYPPRPLPSKSFIKG